MKDKIFQDTVHGPIRIPADYCDKITLFDQKPDLKTAKDKTENVLREKLSDYFKKI